MDVFIVVVVPTAGVVLAGIAVWQNRKTRLSGIKQAAAQRADERLRWQRDQLREIAQRAKLIRSDAIAATKAAVRRGEEPRDTWRSANQDLLANDLAGMPDLPRCLSLTQARGVGTVTAAALAAEEEVEAASRRLQDEWAAAERDQAAPDVR